MNKIEVSNTRGRFTDQEIRQHLAESKKFWSSPAGIAEKRKLDARKRALPPARFPSLGTKPALTAGEARTRHCKNILARIERNTPKI